MLTDMQNFQVLRVVIDHWLEPSRRAWERQQRIKAASKICAGKTRAARFHDLWENRNELSIDLAWTCQMNHGGMLGSCWECIHGVLTIEDISHMELFLECRFCNTGFRMYADGMERE